MADWIAQARARCEQGPDTKLIRNGLFWAGQDPEPAPAAETIHRLCDALDAARTDLPRALDALDRVRALATAYAEGRTTSSSQEGIGRRFLAALDGDA